MKNRFIFCFICSLLLGGCFPVPNYDYVPKEEMRFFPYKIGDIIGLSNNGNNMYLTVDMIYGCSEPKKGDCEIYLCLSWQNHNTQEKISFFNKKIGSNKVTLSVRFKNYHYLREYHINQNLINANEILNTINFQSDSVQFNNNDKYGLVFVKNKGLVEIKFPKEDRDNYGEVWTLIE